MWFSNLVSSVLNFFYYIDENLFGYRVKTFIEVHKKLVEVDFDSLVLDSDIHFVCGNVDLTIDSLKGFDTSYLTKEMMVELVKLVRNRLGKYIKTHPETTLEEDIASLVDWYAEDRLHLRRLDESESESSFEKVVDDSECESEPMIEVPVRLLKSIGDCYMKASKDAEPPYYDEVIKILYENKIELGLDLDMDQAEIEMMLRDAITANVKPLDADIAKEVNEHFDELLEDSDQKQENV